MTNKFRKAFVTYGHEGTDLLSNYAEEIIFMLDGEEDLRRASTLIRDALISNRYNPDLDVIVPVGKISFTFLLALTVARIYRESVITLAIYKNKHYEFTRI